MDSSSDLALLGTDRHDLVALSPAKARDLEIAAATSDDSWIRSVAWAHRWIRSFDSEGTRARYAEAFTTLLWFCRELEVAPMELSRQDIEVWVRELGELGNRRAEHPKPLSASSIRRYISSAKSYFDYCIDNEATGRNGVEMVKNPVKGVRRPAIPEDSRQQYLEPHQVRSIILAAEPSVEMSALVALMLCCLRVSEASAVRVEDLSRSGKHNVVRVRRKGGKVSNVPVPEPEWKLLQRAAGDRKVGYLIRDERTGEPLSRIAIAGRIGTIAKNAGIEGPVGPHTLRHAAITYALDSGAPLHIVQIWAGHANPTTTSIYFRNKDRLDGSPSYLTSTGYYGEAV